MNNKYYVAVNAEQIVQDIIDFIHGFYSIEEPSFSLTFTFASDGPSLEIGVPYSYVSDLALEDGDWLIENKFMEFAATLKEKHNLVDVEISA